jgi:hypothetical protein
LQKWVQTTNSFAEKLYSPKGKMIDSVACSEYRADLQMQILHLDLSCVMEPVLDIGCGKQGNLVLHFRKNGIEAYGFDRFAYDTPFLKHSDWFEYTFENGKWGTIISHLGFSNHFHHHHLRSDGNFIGYAKKYIEILNSLKMGGCFHYAPNLPFVEKYLNREQFELRKYEINDYGFKTSVLKKRTKQLKDK